MWGAAVNLMGYEGYPMPLSETEVQAGTICLRLCNATAEWRDAGIHRKGSQDPKAVVLGKVIQLERLNQALGEFVTQGLRLRPGYLRV